jgi:hypothetical protein
LTEGAAGFLPGVPLGNCLGMREPGSQAPAFPKLLLSKGRGCVRHRSTTSRSKPTPATAAPFRLKPRPFGNECGVKAGAA